MKKNILIIFIYLLFFIVLTNCASTYAVFDESIPMEETAILKVPYNLAVVDFNNISVKWTGRLDTGYLYHGKRKRVDFTAIVPIGENKFVVYYNLSERRGYDVYAYRFEFTHNFEAGKTYNLLAIIRDKEISVMIL